MAKEKYEEALPALTNLAVTPGTAAKIANSVFGLNIGGRDNICRG